MNQWNIIASLEIDVAYRINIFDANQINVSDHL